MPRRRLVLASASPRRAELLRAADLAFDVEVSDVDESVLPGESPESHVRRLAEAKARTVAARVKGRPVLAADTVVVVDGEILGKPADGADARRMLRMLSGRRHEVLTSVCIVWPAEPRPGSGREGGIHVGREADADTRVERTTVEFSSLTDVEIEEYVASGEPADKAGAYGIQGRASRFVTRIDGSYSNVVGLPVSLVYRMCTDAGMLVS